VAKLMQCPAILRERNRRHGRVGLRKLSPAPSGVPFTPVSHEYAPESLSPCWMGAGIVRGRYRGSCTLQNGTYST